ncbi:MAG: hypothetical protein U0K81_06755 [Paludibacteraceae bacterium]|nr:hypothetical protein [Paludibacteraceae bacterium]
MKHIYSIRSIYFKRFTLAALLGVLSISVWANSGDNYGHLSAKTEPNSDSNGAGKIYVSTTALAEGTEPTNLANTQEVVCSATVVKFLGSTLYQGTSTFYCYARETENTKGLWAGWYDNSGVLQGGGEKDIEYAVQPESKDKGKPTSFSLTAKWVQPQVTSSASLDLGTITDKTADVAAQTVTLNIADYSKTEHFKAEPSTVNGFSTSLLSTTEPKDWKGTASVEVDYTPSGKHGPHTATAYLASSLYEGDYTHKYTNDWQPIILTVYENYTPDYEVVHNSFADAYNMGVTNVGGQLTSLEGALKVQDGTKNYAAQQPYYTGIGDNRNTTEWQATIVPCAGYEGYAQYFTIQPGTANTETPVVVFNAGFDVPEKTSQTVYACLNLQCTYHDESSPAKNLTHSQLIYLSATVEQTNEAVLNIITEGDVDEYEFPATYIGATPTQAFALYAANIENLRITQAGDALFAGEIVGSNIRISLNEKVSGQYPSCGTYTATFTVSGVSQLDHTTTHEDQITVTVELLLAPPTLSALGGNQVVTFQWDPVPGATKYIVSSDADGKQNKTETTECVYAVSVVSNNTSVTRYVRAVNDNCQSEVVSATATANLNTITIDNAANTGLLTGTDYKGGATESSFPWRDTRSIDLSAAFDQAGNALFDRLYIFALTTGKKDSELITPCLIYEKNTDTSYTKSNTEITIDKNNTKSAALKIDLQSQGMKKLYFTGYCPYGATGGTTDNGVVHLIGGAQTVDIYLDSLQLYAREKKGGTINITTKTELTNGAYFAQGSGGVFVIESTSTDASHPFNINIHARGNNTLASQNGSKISLNVSQSSVSISDNPIHYSAPIEVLPTSAYSAANITIDDLWPNEEQHTKGVLVLKEWAANKANISIGLGNALTQLQLAGAQLYMRDVAYHTTTYTASKDNVSVSILAYGVTGTSKDYPAKRNANNQIALTDGTYNSLSSDPLKLYTKRLTIDGGTYNADIQHFTDETEQKSTFYNADGKELYKVTVSDANQYGVIANGKYTVTNFAEMVDAFFPHAGVNYQMANTPAPYHAPLSAYYVGTKTYGHSSWAPKNDQQLTLWLPKIDCNAVKIPWQICAPSFVAQVSGENMPLGGKIQKIDGCPMPEHTNQYTVDYLLYMQMDDYTKAALPSYSLKQSNAIEVKIALENDAMYNTIDNESDYTIQKKVYMLMPIEAAKWTLITPPFDVANVYVIESYPEAQLIKDFKGKRGRIPTEYIAAARQAQAQRLMDLYTFWYYEEKGIGEAFDFFGTGDGYTNGYGRFVNAWMEYEKNANWKLDATGDYTPVVEKLIHFTGKQGTYPEGMNWLYANYYLYQSTSEWDYINGKFTTQWDTVTTPLGGPDPIMRKGQTYAMHFPFNSLNGKHDPDQTWDYWTGKYILVESTSTPEPHVISGKANAEKQITNLDLSSETAVLQGNASFAEITPSTSYAIWALEKKETSLSPAQGALVSNFTEPVGLRAIGVHYETGRVIYDSIPQEEPEQEIPTSIPTIMDGLSLVVETIDGGLRITPAQAQQVLLYNAAGQLILNQYLTSTKEVLLPAGVYIIPTGTQQPKRVVVF